MQIPTTASIRPVNRMVDRAVGELPGGAFNFGLYFQKWFYVVDGFQNDGWKKRGAPWACTISDETDLVGGRGKSDYCNPSHLLDNHQVSIALFNKEERYEREYPKEMHWGGCKAFSRAVNIGPGWDRESTGKILDERHAQYEKSVGAYEKLGYHYLRVEATLQAPLVVGLGNEHPTEKGFRFDWTTGIPAIPASSIKGVVRLAYLVNELNKRDEAEAENFWTNVLKGKLEQDAYMLFGCSEGADQKARRGKVIFLDAFPRDLPRLKAEIMNCHYPDYLNKDSNHREFRGPTEDQQPNPQKFWAVDAWTDKERSQPLHFVFRVLVPGDIAEKESWFSGLKQAVSAALDEHGLGAKTAIGHGHFADSAAGGMGQTKEENMPASDNIIIDTTPKDPATARRETLESFSNAVSAISNADLPAQIGTFMQRVTGQEDNELKKQMCSLLVEKGQQLGKKKKFTKALSNGKKWALDLKALCDECGIEV